MARVRYLDTYIFQTNKKMHIATGLKVFFSFDNVFLLKYTLHTYIYSKPFVCLIIIFNGQYRILFLKMF